MLLVLLMLLMLLMLLISSQQSKVKRARQRSASATFKLDFHLSFWNIINRVDKQEYQFLVIQYLASVLWVVGKGYNLLRCNS